MIRRFCWLLALVGILAAPVIASESTVPMDFGDLHKVHMTAGGGLYFMRVNNMPIRPVVTSGVCVPKIPLAVGLTDTVGFSATVERTITFNSASTDSLLKGDGIGARQVKVTWYSGTASDLAAGTITLTGKNILGETISETFTISDNTVGSGVSTQAYSKLTSLVIPIADTARSTCTVSVGRGAGIGLPFTNVLKSPCIMSWKNGSDFTVPIADSVSTSATDISVCMIKPVVAANEAVAIRDYDFLLLVPPYQGTTAQTRW